MNHLRDPTHGRVNHAVDHLTLDALRAVVVRVGRQHRGRKSVGDRTLRLVPSIHDRQIRGLTAILRGLGATTTTPMTAYTRTSVRIADNADPGSVNPGGFNPGGFNPGSFNPGGIDPNLPAVQGTRTTMSPKICPRTKKCK